MNDHRQIHLPERFVQIFIEPGRARPRLTRSELEARHELCEDLSQMLSDTAREQCWSLGITPDDALDRIARGLPNCGLDLEAGEHEWVLARIGEILDWPPRVPAHDHPDAGVPTPARANNKRD